MEQQARLTQPLVVSELVVGAGSNWERAKQEIEGVTDGVGLAVGAEVAIALLALAPHHHRPGPVVEGGDGQERIRLIVHVADVESRLMTLDEGVLQHQRLDLVADLHPLHRLGGLDHLPGAGVEVARILEIVREARPQALRLADVDHPPLGVFKLIRARGIGIVPAGGRCTITSETRARVLRPADGAGLLADGCQSSNGARKRPV